MRYVSIYTNVEPRPFRMHGNSLCDQRLQPLSFPRSRNITAYINTVKWGFVIAHRISLLITLDPELSQFKKMYLNKTSQNHF